MHLHVFTHTQEWGHFFILKVHTIYIDNPKSSVAISWYLKKKSSKNWNYSWFVAWGRKCFTKAVFSKAVNKHYCKHNHYSCPCWWCIKQTQAEEAENVRKEREISREHGKQGWEKQKWGIWHGLALLSGKCVSEARARRRWQLCCWITFGIPEVHWLLLAKGTE